MQKVWNSSCGRKSATFRRSAEFHKISRDLSKITHFCGPDVETQMNPKEFQWFLGPGNRKFHNVRGNFAKFGFALKTTFM